MLWVALLGYVIGLMCVLIARQAWRLGNKISFWIAAILAAVFVVFSTALVVFIFMLFRHPLSW